MRIHPIPLTICLATVWTIGAHTVVAQESESSTAVSRIRLQMSDALWRDSDIAVQPASAAAAPVFEYSDAYRARARIHRIASIATVPLFVTELFLGQSLYNHPSEGKKSAHLVVAGGIAGLFGVNSVTGVWNLMEARRDPSGRGRRWLHGLLMLTADAGFVATAALAPGGESEGERVAGRNGSRSTHRAVAISSIGIASVGYVVMLLGGR